MKNNAKFNFKPPAAWLLLFALGGSLLLFSGCPATRLGVYSLEQYQNYWKGSVYVGPEEDPYDDFWTIMTDPASADPAELSKSDRYKDSEVNSDVVLMIPDDGKRGWDDYDLVFFYGHHNMAVPPYLHHDFTIYTYESGSWNSTVYPANSTVNWGVDPPYDYYAIRPITIADNWPGSVTYLHNKYTSAFVGALYHYGAYPTYKYRIEWDDPLGTFDGEKLGSKQLEWLILHGCQAVITANYYGTAYDDKGLRAFMHTQGKWHIILGHYHSYYTYMLSDLGDFALDLQNGVPVQEAYFNTDPWTNSSAIAAEKEPFTWGNSTMENDRWGDPVADIPGATIFSQRWIQDMGTVADHWE
jgi:hypothetical protein